MTIALVALGIFVLIFYFMPVVIASTRDVPYQFSIFVFNLLFGWTVLGWLVAAIWAVTERPRTYEVDAPDSSAHEE